MIKVVTVIGTRPQYIKAAAISRAFSKRKNITEILVNTGQHYDKNMSDNFVSELNLPKIDYSLNVGSASHGKQTGQMLDKIEEIVLQEKPDYVLVYGDTNSTLAASLVASKLHISLAHVEAGLRSHNKKMPEEINRITSDHVSDLLFVPTITAINNLQKEGITEGVYNVGDVMYDNVLYFGELSSENSKILSKLNLKTKEYILVTIHRAENTDVAFRFNNIMQALAEIAKDKKIVFPVHPRTKKVINNLNISSDILERIQFCTPLGYLDIQALEKNAEVVVTDSGGVQKEAFFHQVPCITLRDETEWTELVDLGWNTLVPPTDVNNIISKIKSAHDNNPSKAENPYGDGHASEYIIDILEKGVK